METPHEVFLRKVQSHMWQHKEVLKQMLNGSGPSSQITEV